MDRDGRAREEKDKVIGTTTSSRRRRAKEKVKAKAKESQRRRKVAARNEDGSKTMAGLPAGETPGESQARPHTTDVIIRGPPDGTV